MCGTTAAAPRPRRWGASGPAPRWAGSPGAAMFAGRGGGRCRGPWCWLQCWGWGPRRWPATRPPIGCSFGAAGPRRGRWRCSCAPAVAGPGCRPARRAPAGRRLRAGAAPPAGGPVRGRGCPSQSGPGLRQTRAGVARRTQSRAGAPTTGFGGWPSGSAPRGNSGGPGAARPGPNAPPAPRAGRWCGGRLPVRCAAQRPLAAAGLARRRCVRLWASRPPARPLGRGRRPTRPVPPGWQPQPWSGAAARGAAAGPCQRVSCRRRGCPIRGGARRPAPGKTAGPGLAPWAWQTPGRRGGARPTPCGPRPVARVRRRRGAGSA